MNETKSRTRLMWKWLDLCITMYWPSDIYAFLQQTGLAIASRTTRCVIKCSFYLCSVLVRQLSHWSSCTVGGPWTLLLLINWATCSQGLRTPGLYHICELYC